MKRHLLLLPLVAALLLVACGGGGVDLDAEATAASDATPSTTLEIRAENLKFDKRALVAPANAAVTLRFVNDERNVLHNVAIYRDRGARDRITATETSEGRRTVEHAFTTPEAGIYYFRCDVHPDMNGAFIVR